MEGHTQVSHQEPKFYIHDGNKKSKQVKQKACNYIKLK